MDKHKRMSIHCCPSAIEGLDISAPWSCTALANLTLAHVPITLVELHPEDTDDNVACYSVVQFTASNTTCERTVHIVQVSLVQLSICLYTFHKRS